MHANSSPCHRISRRGSADKRSAFTLLELLVVLGVLLALSAMLVPALARTGSDTRAFGCLNNTRRLTLAWLMYANDTRDFLIPNPGWVASGSILNWGTSSANTNQALLVDPSSSLIANYVRSAELFKCPADTFQSTSNPGPRARSYSIDGALAGYGGSGPTVQGGGPDGTRLYYGTGQGMKRPAQKLADLATPGPAMVYVIVDEHPDSINDASFMLDPGYPPGGERWRDLPGSHHNGAGSFSFADGHSELHAWEDTRTLVPVSYAPWASNPLHSQVLVVSKDYEWLDDRMPYQY